MHTLVPKWQRVHLVEGIDPAFGVLNEPVHMFIQHVCLVLKKFSHLHVHKATSLCIQMPGILSIQAATEMIMQWASVRFT